MAEVVPINMSQFREGSLGRFSNQDGGIPVYCRTLFIPEDVEDVAGGTSPPVEVIAS